MLGSKGHIAPASPERGARRAGGVKEPKPPRKGEVACAKGA